MPVVPAQAGGPPRGNATSVCEEGETVQPGSVGSNGRERLEAHPDHIMGHRPRKCEYKNNHCIYIKLFEMSQDRCLCSCVMADPVCTVLPFIR